MPAIHKNARQVGSLFRDKLGIDYTEDVDTLIQTGRRVLREKFFAADIGVSGVNFAVAETGTLLLVENEGNGRMSTGVPPVHIAVTGIEKVVENLRDVVPLLSLLTRSALGQGITTYVNMISGPRQADELDGPREVHLVLLDNGRSQAFADGELRQTLNCIRCGACMNHCPVYTRIGGQAYGTVYPGPIGKIISPHLMGLENTPDHPSASSLCGACGEVCPVKIPIPALLRRLREENIKKPDDPHRVMRGQGSKYSATERLIWQLAPAQHLPAALSAVRLLRHPFPGPDAEHRPLGAEPRRPETGGPFAARTGETAPGGQVTCLPKPTSSPSCATAWPAPSRWSTISTRPWCPSPGATRRSSACRACAS